MCSEVIEFCVFRGTELDIEIFQFNFDRFVIIPIFYARFGPRLGIICAGRPFTHRILKPEHKSPLTYQKAHNNG